MRDAIMQEGAKFCEGVLFPLNGVGDERGCQRDGDGNVTTPPGFKNAYDQLVEGGWTAMGVDPEWGGQGLPRVVFIPILEMMSSANMAFTMYPGLTQGAFQALMHGGTQEQKETYLPKMASCEWGGTMNLTEPHCGTDLGLLRTKAVPQGDGSYKISGQKIWISSGEHDLAENIIHLVLARIEGGPEGVKGISLFVVPKFMVNEDGSLGERNNLQCGGLEEKMGIHGNATCVMNYDEATGYLVGEEHKGLKIMFVMMNEARIGVGLQGLSQAEVAYQNSLEFAKDRLQSRSLTGAKVPDKPADPVIVHPDVRRMLLDQKVFIEGSRAFLTWIALQSDLEKLARDEKTRQRASDYMALMTPVIKSYLTGRGFDSISQAMQVFGGAGFTEEVGLSQYLRDARITMIYEGTNGVQALDLVGRKLATNGGRAIFGFLAELEAYEAEQSADEAMKNYLVGLKSARENLKDATDWLMNNALSNFDHAGAASHDYLQILALANLAYMWCQMAKTAMELQKTGGDQTQLYEEKILSANYFFDRFLPDIDAHLTKVKAGSTAMMAFAEEQF